eukprot:1102821-Rhodomonas_salina.2
MPTIPGSRSSSERAAVSRSILAGRRNCVAIASRGQPMSLALDEAQGVVLWGSEASAQVPRNLPRLQA